MKIGQTRSTARQAGPMPHNGIAITRGRSAVAARSGRGVSPDSAPRTETFDGPRNDETETPDEELMIRFRDDHDEGAFEALVRRYERKLFGYLHGILHDTCLAEEVFQSTFLRIHLKCQSFGTGRIFRPWLYAIATHQAIDAMRRERRHRRADCRSTSAEDGGLDSLAAVGLSPVEEAVGREQQGQMRQSVGRLPAIHRTAVQLIYTEGMAYREAADVMGVPVGTVKSRIHAALSSLGRTWGGTATS
jgi:RNA polymerase sigma-70 factor (ECF subfamily)